jgi:molybdate transport system ATP-binding protein
LTIIAGTLRPQQGSVRLGERVFVDTARGIVVPPERRQVGCVFQDLRLFPHLTVEQNLRYGLNRRPARKIDFSRVVEILELGTVLDRSPRTLSGGQLQRTALARAVLQGPELLLLDEPLTALDAGLKDRIVDYLERMLSELRIPTLLVSHDLADVRRLAEQVIILEAGRVVRCGPTATFGEEKMSRTDFGLK